MGEAVDAATSSLRALVGGVHAHSREIDGLAGRLGSIGTAMSRAADATAAESLAVTERAGTVGGATRQLTGSVSELAGAVEDPAARMHTAMDTFTL